MEKELREKSILFPSVGDVWLENIENRLVVIVELPNKSSRVKLLQDKYYCELIDTKDGRYRTKESLIKKVNYKP